MQNKSAIQLMIKWIIANPDVTHAERISKAIEFRDAEENGLREKESQSKYNDALRQAKLLLTKPDSTGGGEKEVCKCPLFLDASYGKCLTCGLDLV